MNYLPFIGRVLVGLPFAMSGPRQARGIWRDDREDRCCWTSIPAARVRDRHTRRVWRWAASNPRLSRALGCARARRLLSGDRDFVSRQFCRPEPDDPLSEERDDCRRAAPNRCLRSRSDQHRAVAPQERRALRDCNEECLNDRPPDQCSITTRLGSASRRHYKRRERIVAKVRSQFGSFTARRGAMLLGIIAGAIGIPPSVALAQMEGRTVTASDTLGANARQVMTDIIRKKDITAVDRYLPRRSYSMTRASLTVLLE